MEVLGYIIAIGFVVFGFTGGRALFRQGGHPDLPTRCKLRIPENVITGDTRRVLTSVVKRETTQTAS